MENFKNDYDINPADFADGLPKELTEYLGWDKNGKRQDADFNSLPPMLAEDCFAISAGSFCRNLLHTVKTSISEGGSLGKSGRVKVWNKLRSLEIDFEVILDNPNDPKLFIQYVYKNSQRQQEILIDTIPAYFGNKPRLLCICGHAGKLYLRPDCYEFTCRGKNCGKLTYEIKKFDKRSVIGLLGYYLNRGFKIGLLKATVKKVSYQGRYTRRALAVVRLNRKWHLDTQAVE
jgi:hypothetical protein